MDGKASPGSTRAPSRSSGSGTSGVDVHSEVNALKEEVSNLWQEMHAHRKVLQEFLEVRDGCMEWVEHREALLGCARVVSELDKKTDEFELSLSGVSENAYRHGRAVSKLAEQQKNTSLTLDAVVRAVKRLDRSRSRSREAAPATTLRPDEIAPDDGEIHEARLRRATGEDVELEDRGRQGFERTGRPLRLETQHLKVNSSLRRVLCEQLKVQEGELFHMVATGTVKVKAPKPLQDMIPGVDMLTVDTPLGRALVNPATDSATSEVDRPRGDDSGAAPGFGQRDPISDDDRDVVTDGTACGPQDQIMYDLQEQTVDGDDFIDNRDMVVDRDSSAYWDWPGWVVGDGDEPMVVDTANLRCVSGGALGSTAQAWGPDSTWRPSAVASDAHHAVAPAAAARSPPQRRRSSPDDRARSSRGAGVSGGSAIAAASGVAPPAPSSASAPASSRRSRPQSAALGKDRDVVGGSAPGHIGANPGGSGGRGGGGPGIPDPSLGGPGDLGGSDPRHDAKSTPNGRRGDRDPGVVNGVKSVLAQLEQALTKLDGASAGGDGGDPSRSKSTPSAIRGRDPGQSADGGGRNPTPLPTPRGPQPRDSGYPQRQSGSMNRGQRKPSRPQSASAGSRSGGSKTNPAAVRTPRRHGDRPRTGDQTWRPAQTWD